MFQNHRLITDKMKYGRDNLSDYLSEIAKVVTAHFL